jgi:hypothetical protein
MDIGVACSRSLMPIHAAIDRGTSEAATRVKLSGAYSTELLMGRSLLS